jgi:hypothetical protein
MQNMDENKRADLLKDEYIMLQTMYEGMDSKGLTIKNWAITVALAIIGTSILNDKKNLLWLAFGSSLIFWYLEAYWRGLSHFFSARIQEIEAAIQTGAWEKELPLQVYSSWTKEYNKNGDQTWRYMWKTASLLPHAVLPFLILAIYFLW